MSDAPDEKWVWAEDCALREHGRDGGACAVRIDGSVRPACEATLRERDGRLERLIHAVHLSRPENYLSIYQSGCNFACRKCHSAEFSQRAAGQWYTVEELVALCRDYEEQVTLVEPRAKATAWHAGDSCWCCGGCVTTRPRSPACPGVLKPDQIVLGPQGLGPARNIVAFTGGDLTCRPDFYTQFARRVKQDTKLWMLIETNGWGLATRNLDLFQEAGVDAFWLDIKAYDEKAHTWLTGCSNRWILMLPQQMLERGFVLEVLSLYIPGLVETDQLRGVAELLCSTSENIPFTILAFFPQYKMMDFRAPTTEEMIAAYDAAMGAGLKNVRLSNIGVFAKTAAEVQQVLDHTGLTRQTE